MDGSNCGHEVHQADCPECILLAAGVPHSTYPPIIRAARHPDISPLRSLLINLPATHLDPGRVSWPCWEVSNGEDGVWKSPLTEAILARLPENAALLLEYHADPNGFPTYIFRCFSSCFVRHRPLRLRAGTLDSSSPRENLLDITASPQTGPLTDDEIEARRSSRCRFWAEKDFPSLKSAFKGPITALEAAAKEGDKESFARLAEAGADTAAWMTEHQNDKPDAASPSHLTLSTPLHRAIEADNPAMVAYLLSSGHNPSYFPLSTPTRSLNATMHLLTLPSPSPLLLNLLLPATALSARTPIYNCHILQIAAATLNLSLFQQIAEAVGSDATDLSALEPTALGHTVLHVACLPRDDFCVNVHSEKIYASVHEVRTLNETWQPRKLWPHSPKVTTPATGGSQRTARGHGVGSMRGGLHSTPGVEEEQEDVETGVEPASHLPIAEDLKPEHDAQSALVRHLLTARYADPLAALAATDVHGNTPLHYLASARHFNERLWSWICGMIKRWRKAQAAGTLPPPPPPPPPPQQQHREETDGNSGGSNGVNRGTTAADGYDPLIAIQNRWGYTPADFYVDNMEARKEWGREFMPFWRDQMPPTSGWIGRGRDREPGGML
ncbi:hypothetical protein MMC08_000216 [Hypocenomyce scalaris]|nr:hypothetical protein [Hypocenomyce scalaris]